MARISSTTFIGKRAVAKVQFPRVVRGIDLLRHANIPFYVISVLTRDALRFPDKLFDFYRRTTSRSGIQH